MDYHSLDVTGLSVCLVPTAADSCPNMAAQTCRETAHPGKSQLITRRHTDTEAEGGNSVSVYVIGQAVQLVLVKAPGQRERNIGVRGWVAVRPVGCYLISLGWDPGLCRPDEERRKLNHSLLLWV